MWLQKDERHLLLGYYVNIFNIDDRNVCKYRDKPKCFEMTDWTDVLRKPCWIPVLTPCLIKRAARGVKAYGDRNGVPPSDHKGADELPQEKEVRIQIKLDRRLQLSNSGLEKRNLINVQKHQHCDKVAGISLTMEGYDLARKYNSWWSRSNLWYTEYIKHHWICVVAGFLGGILSHWLLSRFVR